MMLRMVLPFRPAYRYFFPKTWFGVCGGVKDTIVERDSLLSGGEVVGSFFRCGDYGFWFDEELVMMQDFQCGILEIRSPGQIFPRKIVSYWAEGDRRMSLTDPYDRDLDKLVASQLPMMLALPLEMLPKYLDVGGGVLDSVARCRLKAGR